MAPRETKVASKLGEVKEWVWAQSAKRPGEASGGEVAAPASVPWERSQCMRTRVMGN